MQIGFALPQTVIAALQRPDANMESGVVGLQIGIAALQRSVACLHLDAARAGSTKRPNRDSTFRRIPRG